MRNEDCVDFLQWCLPKLGMRWAGFRKVRGTVCKRVARRLSKLGLSDVAAYRSYLEAHPDEWPRLDAMCRIPISRFWRDRAVFDCLARTVLPALAAAAVERGDGSVRVWSAGCASGEEPYSLRLGWSLEAEAVFPDVRLEIVATDIDDTMLSRAAAGLYQAGSLHDLPPELLETAFLRSDGLYEIAPRFRRDIQFLRQDIRIEMPAGLFDLILCRNLVFTYFDEPTQAELLAKMCARLRPGGSLVIGAHETLPKVPYGFASWNGPAQIYRFAPPIDCSTTTA